MNREEGYKKLVKASPDAVVHLETSKDEKLANGVRVNILKNEFQVIISSWNGIIE